MDDNTIKFVVPDDTTEEMKAILTAVYGALSEKGYNPINQIVGYLLSEDPTYITNYNNARSLICKLDRDELSTGAGAPLSVRVRELQKGFSRRSY